ncbi:ABC-2 type transporter [Candidatus Burarchaeum australiense]|nr:ABC-2 type transporter [Candidatus Burarchaeum australiense]
MSEAEAVLAMWRREFIVYLRERERIISSIVSPIMWIVLFGTGLGANVEVQGYNYQQFMFPGIVAMTVLFTSTFYGIYIIWDRKLDFLKAVLVAPVSRGAVFFGKLLGGCTESMLQGLVVLLLGLAIGISFTPYSFVLAFLLLIPLSLLMGSLGLIIGSNLKTQEAFGLVINFVMWPMFFLSGALFPTGNLPAWLATLTYLNPLTYGVDALRGAILGPAVQQFPLYVDLGAMLLFMLLSFWIGIVSFGHMQQAK